MISVVDPGLYSTVQDAAGRTGYWHVGVPPSGAMDEVSLRLGNRAVGNASHAAGIECTAIGPTFEARADLLVCVSGAAVGATVDGRPIAMWEPLVLRAGSVLSLGRLLGAGLRTYLAVQGGIAVAPVLGSRSTFTLGGFGGHQGRPLERDDVLEVGDDVDPTLVPSVVPAAARPGIGGYWRLHVLEGPHAAPEFVTHEGMDELFATTFEVDTNSSRTGVRLRGVRPGWARTDGGEAGLHPSNIHDTGYAIGAVDLTGDMPILLGPDGPSCGGFVCPAVVARADRWKLGQLAPGDRVRLVPIAPEQAATLDTEQQRTTRTLAVSRRPPAMPPRRDRRGGVVHERPARDRVPPIVHRRAGDRFLLVEYGPMALDLELRARVHALEQWLATHPIDGIVDVTPGVRSLLVHVDGHALTVEAASRVLADAEDDLETVDELVAPSRVVHLPLSFDDPAAREAVARYEQVVRSDAPWCPSNIEFIRRINGLDSIDDVRAIVFAASYLVLGLGDVYLGAPVATPVDPRHRLVTTKYNPARTWTPENAVGIGGAYLCVYGMEGPGGYQLVGRTVPVWSLAAAGPGFEPGVPWLLRSFDRLHFYPVGADELLDLRADLRAGRWGPDIEPGALSLAAHRAFLDEHAAAIEHTRAHRRAAFAAERRRWEARGELTELVS